MWHLTCPQTVHLPDISHESNLLVGRAGALLEVKNRCWQLVVGVIFKVRRIYNLAIDARDRMPPRWFKLTLVIGLSASLETLVESPIDEEIA